MLIYNVTSKVSWEVLEDWVEWMLREHMAEVMETGLFSKHQLVRLQDVDDDDGATFAVQYYIDSRENYDAYKRVFAPVLAAKVIARWSDRVLSFSTLMEVIN